MLPAIKHGFPWEARESSRHHRSARQNGASAGELVTARIASDPVQDQAFPNELSTHGRPIVRCPRSAVKRPSVLAALASIKEA